VVPQIIEVLQGDDPIARREIYHNLDRSYDEKFKIEEPGLTNAILKNISILEDEKMVIQLAGYMKLKGHPEVFESLLLSGTSTDVDRLIYWLGQDGKSEKTLDYCNKLIFQKDFDFEDHSFLMAGLNEFEENGNQKIRNQVLEICLAIYNAELIPWKNFEEMKNSFSSGNPAEELSEILFRFDDDRIAPLAKSLYSNKIRVGSALTMLIKLGQPNTKEMVFSLLKNEEQYFDGLLPAEALYKSSKDEEIIKTILVEFEKKSPQYDYTIDRIVSSLLSMEAHHCFDKLEQYISNQSLIENLQRCYKVSSGTVEDVANDLYQMKIVKTPYPAEVIDQAKKETEFSGIKDYVYNFLKHSGIHLRFDAETGFVPVDYDNLILDFAKKTVIKKYRI